MNEPRKYSKAPVALAVIEVKHPVSELTRGEALGMRPALRSHLPFHREDDQVSHTVDFGPGGASASSSNLHLHYFESRTRRTRFACSAESTSIETAEYDRWAALLDLFRTGLSARVDVAEIDGVTRLGLRYIDEIRVPVDGQPRWSDWIAQEFLPPQLSNVGLEPQQQNCVVQYGTGQQGVTVTARYGAVHAPPAVMGDLRPDAPGPGHYFLLDTDVAWEVSPGFPVPELDIDWLVGTLDDLHSHAGNLFESLLIDRLRDEVLQ